MASRGHGPRQSKPWQVGLVGVGVGLVVFGVVGAGVGWVRTLVVVGGAVGTWAEVVAVAVVVRAGLLLDVMRCVVVVVGGSCVVGGAVVVRGMLVA